MYQGEFKEDFPDAKFIESFDVSVISEENVKTAILAQLCLNE